MQVKLADVAKHAGVSVTTVSYVLNHPDRVSPAIRTSVRQSIQELGYVRNLSASALRSGVSSVVAMVVVDISDPFFSLVAASVERELGERDLMMTLSSTNSRREREQSLARTLAAQRHRGIILAQTTMDTQSVREIQAAGIPVVLFDSPQVEEPAISSVCADDVSGAASAMKLLMDLGHREIAFINGPLWASQAKERLAGVRLAVEQHPAGDRVHLTAVNTEGWTPLEGRLQLEAILDMPGPRPTAYFCGNDMIAMGVLNQLVRLGYSVGHDVSVIGFDDIPLAQELSVPLTTVLRSTEEFARASVEILLSDEQPQHRMIETELVVRESTGPVPA